MYNGRIQVNELKEKKMSMTELMRREIAGKVNEAMQRFSDDEWPDEVWDVCVAVCAEYGITDDNPFVSELCDNWADWC